MTDQKKLKTVNIKGKEYVEVATRIVAFNQAYENGRIETYAENINDHIVRFKAIVTPDCGKPERYFTGWAEEDRRQGNINKTNAVENCETSAVGRALAMMGIGIIDGVASADEVRHAVHKQEVTPEHKQVDPKWDGVWDGFVMPFGKHQGKTLGIIALEAPTYLSWLIEQRQGGKGAVNPDLDRALKAYQDATNSDSLLPTHIYEQTAPFADLPEKGA